VLCVDALVLWESMRQKPLRLAGSMPSYTQERTHCTEVVLKIDCSQLRIEDAASGQGVFRNETHRRRS
jgi:hypothetical protein